MLLEDWHTLQHQRCIKHTWKDFELSEAIRYIPIVTNPQLHEIILIML